MSETWAPIAADLRRALEQRGHYAHEIDATLDALAPVVAAVERAGTVVDEAAAWALLAVAADRQRRRAAQRLAG
jgi:hypothetical protein